MHLISCCRPVAAAYVLIQQENDLLSKLQLIAVVVVDCGGWWCCSSHVVGGGGGCGRLTILLLLAGETWRPLQRIASDLVAQFIHVTPFELLNPLCPPVSILFHHTYHHQKEITHWWITFHSGFDSSLSLLLIYYFFDKLYTPPLILHRAVDELNKWFCCLVSNNTEMSKEIRAVNNMKR